MRQEDQRHAVIPEAVACHWDEGYGHWVVTRYDAAALLLRREDAERQGILPAFEEQWSEVRVEAATIRSHLNSWPLYKNGADHARIREVMRQSYGPRLMGRVRRRVERTAAALLDGHSGPLLDLLSGYAIPLARATLAELLVMSDEEISRAQVWSDELLRFLREPKTDAQIRATAQAIDELRGWSARLCARSDLLHGSLPDVLCRAHAAGELGSEEVAGIVAQNVTGGLGAMTQVIANGSLWLLRHGGGFAQLRDDSRLVGRIVEGILRAEPAFRWTPTMRMAPVEHDGLPAEACEAVAVQIEACNRDSDAGRHLSFGLGPHACVGAGVTRAVLRVAIMALAHRFSDIELAGEPDRVPLFGLDAMELLLVVADERPSGLSPRRIAGFSSSGVLCRSQGDDPAITGEPPEERAPGSGPQ